MLKEQNKERIPHKSNSMYWIINRTDGVHTLLVEVGLVVFIPIRDVILMVVKLPIRVLGQGDVTVANILYDTHKNVGGETPITMLLPSLVQKSQSHSMPSGPPLPWSRCSRPRPPPSSQWSRC